MKWRVLILFSLLAGPGYTSEARAPDAEWTYRKTGDRELKLYAFLPDGYASGKDFPAMVFFHGGAWTQGDPSGGFTECEYWASQGMVAVSVDYRLKERDQVEVPLECIKDAKSAIRFLRAGAGRLKIDPDRIVAAGESAGGQLAAATATITGDETNDGQDDLSVSCVPNAVVLYNPWFRCREDLNPPSHVRTGLPPMITFHGEKDPIPPGVIQDFHHQLLKAGGDSEFFLAHGQEHGFCNPFRMQGRNPYYFWSLEHAGRFLARHGILTNPPAVSLPEGVTLPDEKEYAFYGRDSGADKMAARPRPNIILMLTDDLGWQDVGCYDIDEPSPMETPNIDRLAKKGVLFRQGYAPAPTCAPTRCAIMSGKHPARIQKTHVVGGAPPHPHHRRAWAMMEPWYSGRMGLEEVTLAEALQKEGYVTGHCGKWHMAIDHSAFPQPMDQGFDWTRSNLGVTRRMAPNRLTGFATDAPDDPFRLDENGFPHHQNSEDALTFVRENKDRPFFLYYATWLVHTPIHTRSKSLLDKYVKKLGVELPENPDDWAGEGQTNPFYCAMVEELDYHVGRLMKLLEETEDPRWPGHRLSENTYIIFTSDNGGMEQVPGQIITDNYPLDRGKISLMEGGTRVPLIIAGPGIPAGVDSEVMVNGLDFYPTILSFIGAEKPEGQQLDGSDLSTLLQVDPANPELVTGPDGKPRDTMVWHFPHSVALESTIREGDYKLVRNYNHRTDPNSPELELYRLYRTEGGVQVREDIEEAKNLAESMPEKAHAMNERLSVLLEEMEASYPYYNPGTTLNVPHKEQVPEVVADERVGDDAVFTYRERGASVVRADLIYTLNGGGKDEEWFRAPVRLLPDMKASVTLPEGTTHYFLNLIDENGFLVSYPDPLGDQVAVTSPKHKYAPQAIPAGDKPPVDATGAVRSNPVFRRLDLNHDGRVTRSEYVSSFVNGFDSMDRDGNEVLNEQEYPYPASIQRGDGDGDGMLSREEFFNIYDQQFLRQDRNKDGALSANEL